jgi:hypothetical protein
MAETGGRPPAIAALGLCIRIIFHIAWQVVEKRVFNHLLTLSVVSPKGRTIGRQPALAQGVETSDGRSAQVHAFFNTLLFRTDRQSDAKSHPLS